MIFKKQKNAYETEITIGDCVYVNESDYGIHVDWSKLSPPIQKQLSEIATQAEELRVRCVKLMQEQYESGIILHAGEEPVNR